MSHPPAHPTPALTQVRNIGVVAHVDAGKTTLTERLLFYTGALHKIGEVHAGAAHMDWMVEEQEHGITITAAVTQAHWRECLLQIVDTPGHVDFTIEVERSMRVLDGLILVLDGVRGIEPQTETVWRQRSHFGLPVLFFINKLDRPGADFTQVVAELRSRFAINPVAVTLPVPDQPAVIDLLHAQLLQFSGEQGEVVTATPCPPALWQSVASWREALLMAAAEVDERLTDRVLAGDEPSAAELSAALRLGTLNGQIFPCYAGSALRNVGVQPLLDGIVDFLPTPLDRPPAIAHRPDGSTETVTLGDSGALVALVFKVQLWDGRRHCFTRIYRSQLHPGDVVEFLNTDGQRVRETVARVFDVDADRKIKLDVAAPGQIVLLAGLRHATTGDTLCSPGQLLRLERIETRQPVLSLAVEPLHSTDEERLLEALDKIAQEDPTFKVEEDADTGQRLLRGMGELHLQIVLERLQREFHLQVRSGRPAVAVRETVTRAVTAEALYSRPPSPDGKQAALTAWVAVAVTPRERSAGNQLTVTPAVRPAGAELKSEQRLALENGARLALATGPLHGAPVEDVALTVTTVELFGQASSPDALAAAVSKAVHQALTAAAPQALYPLMHVEVTVPADHLGTVLGDLQARRAVIHGTTMRHQDVRIECEVLLAALLGYATELRSLTQGRGQFSMTFERFDMSAGHV
ncbi:elongation factor G [Rhodopseudomonas palustris]|uniref:Elongation factor G n=1 Tax=Thiospirillum jenense TaxID=1653858 RepID=A0A839HQ90_9GAMM|nr:elongation factor G [Thiospirillum jenense]MBB1093592.1 elongation factor G [Rhodopseudomonas palustris]MBB1127272.1 elongation factor G [Thiospirillum jenense]